MHCKKLSYEYNATVCEYNSHLNSALACLQSRSRWAGVSFARAFLSHGPGPMGVRAMFTMRSLPAPGAAAASADVAGGESGDGVGKESGPEQG